MKTRNILLPSFLLTGCSTGDWVATTWGEAFIEDGIESGEFVDSCSATFDAFEVELTSAQLLLADETVIAEATPARIDLVQPGPHELASVSVAAGVYERVYYGIGPADGDSVRTAGSVTCGDTTVTFDWSFDRDTTYQCLPLEIEVPADDSVTTELTIHGDHLFYDSLDEDGGDLRGQAIVDADADADGEVTMAELEAVDITGLDYPLGLYPEVTNLGDFIRQLVQGVGHIDGEGHCYVEG